jgi:hypothetical protein
MSVGGVALPITNGSVVLDPRAACRESCHEVCYPNVMVLQGYAAAKRDISPPSAELVIAALVWWSGAENGPYKMYNCLASSSRITATPTCNHGG